MKDIKYKDQKYLQFKYYLLSLEMQAFYHHYMIDKKYSFLPVFQEIEQNTKIVKRSYERLITLLSPAYRKLLRNAPFAEKICSQ